MKFTLSWLKEYLDTDSSLDEISQKLTAIGLEVEEIVDRREELAPFKVAEIIEAEKHPNADKLQVCKVNTGTETLQIVCGAPNARAGIKVVLANVGVVIPTNGMKIKQSKIRDIDSSGMLCSADELAVGSDSKGIIELPQEAIIGEEFAGFTGDDDPLIEIAITPNRGDCLGVFGIARDLAASGLGTLKSEGVTAEEFQHVLDDGSFDSPISVSIDGDTAKYFIGRTIQNVKNPESPDWLKKRLESIGLRPISALVDITNYITMAFGRPSHIYDADKINGDLVVREAKEGEEFVSLEGKPYIFDALSINTRSTVENIKISATSKLIGKELEYISVSSSGLTVIADNKEVVALGGLIGGEATGCSDETKNIFIEVALFDPIDVATSGRKLQIESDARYRFERTVAASTLKHFITITNLVNEICGDDNTKISKPVVAGSISMERVQIEFNPNRASEMIGIEISKTDIARILNDLGFKIDKNGEMFTLGVPSYRPDVTIEEDVVEEIIRIYGFEKIPTTYLPRPSRKIELDKNLTRLYRINRKLASQGLKEVVSFSFLSSEDANRFANGNKLVELANPISSDLSVMRSSILPNLLNIISKNMVRGHSNISLFEVGPVFYGITPDQQKRVAAGVRYGKSVPKNHYSDSRDFDVFDVKKDSIEALSEYISADSLRINRDCPEYYHPGKSGALCLGKAVLGYFGEIHPAILKEVGIKQAVFAFEVFPDNAPKAKEKNVFLRPKLEISVYQPVERDFAFVVSKDAEIINMINAVKKVDKKLIRNVSIFDVYTGDNVDEDKKSVAMNVLMQSDKDTISDNEIEKISNDIISNVIKAVGGELRK